MATEIIVTKWCDVCLYEDNANTPAETRAIPVPGQVKTVDLCDKHDEAILAPVRHIYDEYGIKPERTPRSSSNGSGVPCPSCGRQSPNVSLMRAHVKRMHKDEAEQLLDLNGSGHHCDQCDFVAMNPQGLGAHRSAAHGIIGTSKSAVHNREQNGELAQSA